MIIDGQSGSSAFKSTQTEHLAQSNKFQRPELFPQILVIDLAVTLSRITDEPTPMLNTVSDRTGRIPPELTRLRERISSLPGSLRDELAPLADEAVEQAIFRARVVAIAREGLERYRLDLTLAQFDLEATRRERETLRQELERLGR